MKYGLCSPTPPRNPASLGCCAVCVCHVLYGGISYLGWMDKPGQVSLFKFVQPLLCPGKNKSGSKECLSTLLGPALGGTSWSSAQPPCSARGGNCCPVWGISSWKTLQMHFPLTSHFWEFTGEVVRGDFTPLPVALQSLFERRSALTPMGFLQCLCPSDGAGMQVVLQGWCSECLSMLLLLCVEVVSWGHKLTGDPPDAGTVPASGELVVWFFPRSDCNKEGIWQRGMYHFPIIDGKRRRMPLVTDVLSCLSGNNSYSDGVGCSSACTTSAWPCSGQERHSSRDSPDTAQAGRLCSVRWTSIGQGHFFTWKEGTTPTQKGVLNSFLCWLMDFTGLSFYIKAN